MSVRIDLTVWPRTLVDLEDLCRVARQQGFPDDASVGFGVGNHSVSVTIDADSLVTPDGES